MVSPIEGAEAPFLFIALAHGRSSDVQILIVCFVHMHYVLIQLVL